MYIKECFLKKARVYYTLSISRGGGGGRPPPPPLDSPLGKGLGILCIRKNINIKNIIACIIS